ncbi:MAG: prenyltransferase/squalene oxidase repeat-containing protein [Gemmataceae bacterium]
MRPALIVAVLLFAGRVAWADEPDLDLAVRRGLSAVQSAAAIYPKHRKCFSCHHQTLPMLAVATARDRGLATDAKLLAAQAEFTRESFLNKIDDLHAGKNIGGRGMTVGYALWALALADSRADDTTEALAAYLLKTQAKDGSWAGQATRPPLEESKVTGTVLAVAGLKRYATEEQRQLAVAAIDTAKGWLVAAKPVSQEDRAARLWGLFLLKSKPAELDAARTDTLAAQRPDGGWAQTDSMASDAYATGQALYVLHTTGLPVTDPAYRRGVRFLLLTQRPDGAWLVKTRSKPIQPYVEADDLDPLGKDQFISVPATGWAVAALAAAHTDKRKAD